LIRVMRLIWGIPVHRINHIASIHHDKRIKFPLDLACAGTTVIAVLGRDGLRG
jgi:hypothetical protein